MNTKLQTPKENEKFMYVRFTDEDTNFSKTFKLSDFTTIHHYIKEPTIRALKRAFVTSVVNTELMVNGALSSDKKNKYTAIEDDIIKEMAQEMIAYKYDNVKTEELVYDRELKKWVVVKQHFITQVFGEDRESMVQKQKKKYYWYLDYLKDVLEEERKRKAKDKDDEDKAIRKYKKKQEFTLVDVL